jgi:hypothetical protein
MTSWKDDWNWQEAFNLYAKEFSMEDIQDVLGQSDGENDERDWLMIGKLKDGRYFKLKAGCDYTGWGCRDWGESCFATTLDNLIKWELTSEDRSRLGIAEPK